jgi:hypothetical protein
MTADETPPEPEGLRSKLTVITGSFYVVMSIFQSLAAKKLALVRSWALRRKWSLVREVAV